MILFKKTRQEYLRRPEITAQISSRTILVTAIPSNMVSEATLTEKFGPGVEKVWINRDHSDLQDLVDDRNKAASSLEAGENALIKKCNKLAIKKGKKDPPADYDKNIWTLYLPDKKRPHMKLGPPVIKLLFGKKVYSLLAGLK